MSDVPTPATPSTHAEPGSAEPATGVAVVDAPGWAVYGTGPTGTGVLPAPAATGT